MPRGYGAEAGQLETSEGIGDAAVMLLEDPRARARIARFHALWLAYENLSREGLYGDTHAESRALVERVVFPRAGPTTTSPMAMWSTL